SPSSGPSGQVTFVTITGSGFSSNSCIVKFGDVTAVANRDAATPTTKYDAITPTSIGPGTVDVRVTCGSQTSPISSAAKFTFTAQGAAPTITSLSPSSGAASTANIEVTINGTNLGGALSVTFGGTNASIVANSNTATQIKVIAPAKTAGKVEVVVTTAGGSNNTANDANDFTYVNANLPTVTGLSPNTGPINSSSISVTITGTNFNGATEVKFDNVLVTSFSQPNSTTIVVTAPLRATTGTVQVTVKTPEGTSSTDGTGNDFSYTSGPTTTTLTLFFRWTLVAWAGKDNMTVQDALKGLESPDVPATNNILASVSVIYRWSPDGVGCPSGTSQCWLANFPNAGNVPGANDFTTLRTTFVYWIAVLSQVQWTVLQGP
ncbi:MAG: IPT/TIG domain-containing protein, partial [Dehalococcoidia bacterium]